MNTMSNTKDIFFVLTEKHIGAVIEGKYPIVSYAPRKEFSEFIASMVETFPKYKMRCVKDKKLETMVLDRVEADSWLKASNLFKKSCKNKNNNIK